MAEVLGIVGSAIAVVELSTKLLSLCFQYSQKVKNAKHDIETLRKEIASFHATTEDLETLIKGPRGEGLKASQRLSFAIEDGASILKKLEQRLQPSTGRKIFGSLGIREFKWPFESKEIQEIIQNLERCRAGISLALNIDQTAILQNTDDRTALNQLPIAHGASFDSQAEEHNPKCLPNTRRDTLEKIDRWIEDRNSKTIYWLNGMAGTGKSTIARTVALSRSKQGDLGASFFFKRGEMDRGNMNKLMTTLAHQLALSVPGVTCLIKKALDGDPSIVQKSSKEQFQKLVQEPLSEAASSQTTVLPIVLVIDALDECEKENEMRSLIEILSQAEILLPQLRVFLTSRPELPVRLGFSKIKGSYKELILHEIPVHAVEHDIQVFLDDEFKRIRDDFNATVCTERKLPSDWPDRRTMEDLAKMAVPLFIFAATVCRFVGDRRRNPQIRLKTMLNYSDRSHASQLDQTYAPILYSQLSELSEGEKGEIIRDFRAVIGSIVILASPLSIAALSQLIDVPPEAVEDRLDGLHSVLNIPSKRSLPVRLLHLSFRDYLLSMESEFRVDERDTHRNLAKHCLRVMSSALHENIGGLPYPGALVSTVDTVKLKERIPSQLEYACLHWVRHHLESTISPNDDDVVYSFLTTHFLHWVEALSLLGRFKECLESLWSLAKWKEADSRLSMFVADASRFLQSYSVIAEAPLQAYCCLVFAPSASIVRRTFRNDIPRWIVHFPNVERHWDACLLTLEGHGAGIISVIFSHNSKKLASASNDDTVRIWDMDTGECERVLEGHGGWERPVVFSHCPKIVASGCDAEMSGWKRVLECHGIRVRSVVFSHNLKELGSASRDARVLIWDTETVGFKQRLEGHFGAVDSVVFSHDSKKVAAPWNLTVRIWDTQTGRCEQVLEGHNHSVESVAFSHDSKKLASASWDTTVRIWDTETGGCKRILEGHDSLIDSVVFSHDSEKVASASWDETIRIWDAETGKCERVLEGHGDLVQLVVFSHDSKKVASASGDETIRIWDAETGKCERVLKGHGGKITSVVFSHDSRRLASASWDKTVRIWDINMGEHERVPDYHSSKVKSVVFSQDLKRVASTSDDDTVRIWDTETGECRQVLEGHSNQIRSAVFSGDSTKLATATNATIRIWNTETGVCERMLKGHSSWVHSAVFSHDLTKLASASDDETVRIWHIETGECERVLEGHVEPVKSVVFSHNSKKVASASDDKTVRIWDTETGECETVLEPENHTIEVHSVFFSHDSRKVALTSLDNSVRIWDTETGECMWALQCNGISVLMLVFSDNSKKAASTSLDQTIRFRDAEIGECGSVPDGRCISVLTVLFPHNSRSSRLGRDVKTIWGWNMKTRKLENIIAFDGYTTILSFKEGAIITGHRAHSLAGHSTLCPTRLISSQSAEGPMLAIKGNAWVTVAGKDFLWLPPQCRNGTKTIAGDKIAIGCHSGRVMILGISLADVCKIADV